jgi:hypothetical protein
MGNKVNPAERYAPADFVVMEEISGRGGHQYYAAKSEIKCRGAR